MTSEAMRKLIENVSLNEVRYQSPDAAAKSVSDLAEFFTYLNQNLQPIKVMINPQNPRAKAMLQGYGIVLNNINQLDWIYEKGHYVLGGSFTIQYAFHLLKQVSEKANFDKIYLTFSVRDSDNYAYRMDIDYLAEGTLKEDPDEDVRVAEVKGKRLVVLSGQTLSSEELRQFIWD